MRQIGRLHKNGYTILFFKNYLGNYAIEFYKDKRRNADREDYKTKEDLLKVMRSRFTEKELLFL